MTRQARFKCEKYACVYVYAESHPASACMTREARLENQKSQCERHEKMLSWKGGGMAACPMQIWHVCGAVSRKE